MNFKYDSEATFNPTLHAKYLLRFLDVLPAALSKCDTTRVTIAYFAVSGLDVLNALELINEEKKKHIIQWIYSLQVINNEELTSGFQGSTTFNTLQNRNKNAPYKWSHLAGTYCALCSLVILGDDLSNVNRDAVIKGVKALQLPNGCYTGAKEGTESDMRFLFTAAAICYILNDWSGMDVDKAVDFIKKSISYDYGIAQGIELESHGGSTYCALATLSLLNELNQLSEQELTGVRRWLLNRQIDGFQGRPNKPVDTCYSFWVGAALKLVDAFNLIDFEQNRCYVMATQNDVIGGFAKWTDGSSDPLHTYMGLAGLSLIKEKGLREIVPHLNITRRAYNHLQSIQKQW